MDVTADGYYVYENIEHDITSESSGDAVNLPVVGFSVPCTYKEGQNKYTIDHDNEGNPIIEDSYINTSAPYPEAKYCNVRICYPHKKINEDVVFPSTKVLIFLQITTYSRGIILAVSYRVREVCDIRLAWKPCTASSSPLIC